MANYNLYKYKPKLSIGDVVYINGIHTEIKDVIIRSSDIPYYKLLSTDINSSRESERSASHVDYIIYKNGGLK